VARLLVLADALSGRQVAEPVHEGRARSSMQPTAVPVFGLHHGTACAAWAVRERWGRSWVGTMFGGTRLHAGGRFVPCGASREVWKTEALWV
jgi:hypothetical protein